ncbi:hypothetical protein, partial [Odoribacter laneus]|jgi:hypothetical protein|uniref:hypothetical protein n=1 Tax=Odoribacter laneus TaxID=626933 RepID=UPI004029CB57
LYIGYFLLPNKILNYSYFIYTTPSKPILNYLMNGFKYIFFKIKQIYKNNYTTLEKFQISLSLGKNKIRENEDFIMKIKIDE